MACQQTSSSDCPGQHPRSKSGSPRDIPGLHHLTSMRPPSSSCVTAAEARDRVHCTALQATAYFALRELDRDTLEHFRACQSTCDECIWIPLEFALFQEERHLRSTFQCIGMHSQQKRIRGRAKQISSVQRKLQRISREYQRNGWNEIYNTFS